MLLPLVLFGAFTAMAVLQDTGERIREYLKPSVVRLMDESQQGWGTGFSMLDKDGKHVFLTNAHVCEGNRFLVSEKEGKTVKHKVIKISQQNDICMVEGDDSMEPLELAEETIADQKIFSLGYPLEKFQNFTRGELKGLVDIETPFPTDLESCEGRKYLEKRIFIGPEGVQAVCFMNAKMNFTNMPVDGGASGSPVVNEDGEVVGIVSLRAGNVSWAMIVPLEDIQAFLKE